MRWSFLFRAAATVAVVIAAVVGLAVDRTVRQAQDSNERVVHTQEVLAQLDTVLQSLIAIEDIGARPSASAGTPPVDRLDGAERGLGVELDRLTVLVSDNPSQQNRTQGLRRDVSRLVEVLRRIQTNGAVSPADAAVERAAMDGARRTVQDMRFDEQRLLRERALTDRTAVRRLQWISRGVVLGGIGLLGWVFWTIARVAQRQQVGADALRQAKADLEAQMDARTGDLRDSTARLQSIIDSAVDGIIVIDAAGRIEAFNRGAERLFGYAAAEVRGRNVNTLMPSPHHQEHDGYLARYLQTGQAKIIGAGREVVGRRRDGSTFPLHLSVGEMMISGERKFTGMLHDLSERVRLEERLRSSEARWRSIVQSAVDGIVVIDAHGRIEAFNPAAERLFGYSEQEVKGRNVNVLMPAPYHEEHDVYLARYLATGVPKIIGTGREVTGLRRDGTTFPLHLSVGELTVNGERKFTGILHDLSVRVRMEEQLREQAALVTLGEMAAVLAHEIKNPLAGIRGAIQIIGTRLPADGRDAPIIKEVVSRIDGLNDLMKDLLLFARPPQPRPSAVELEALVSSTAALLMSDPALQGLEVTVEGSVPPVHADPELLKIVFVNLLVNGAHAMKGRGTIQVSLTLADGTCQVRFADRGPGIPADVREKIFTPFFTTKARGSGLGLPTAKRLIEAHGGTIAIACPAGMGTTVTVHLPASAAPA